MFVLLLWCAFLPAVAYFCLGPCVLGCSDVWLLHFAFVGCCFDLDDGLVSVAFV
jgi:hypothetical protein